LFGLILIAMRLCNFRAKLARKELLFGDWGGSGGEQSWEKKTNKIQIIVVVVIISIIIIVIQA